MTSKTTKKAFHVPPPSRQEVSMQNHTGKNAFRFSLHSRRSNPGGYLCDCVCG